MDARDSEHVLRVLQEELKRARFLRSTLRRRGLNKQASAYQELSREIERRKQSIAEFENGLLVWVRVPGCPDDKPRFMIGNRPDDETVEESVDRLKQLRLTKKTTNGNGNDSTDDKTVHEGSDSSVRRENGVAEDSNSGGAQEANQRDAETHVPAVVGGTWGDEDRGGLSLQ